MDRDVSGMPEWPVHAHVVPMARPGWFEATKIMLALARTASHRIDVGTRRVSVVESHDHPGHGCEGTEPGPCVVGGHRRERSAGQSQVAGQVTSGGRRRRTRAAGRPPALAGAALGVSARRDAGLGRGGPMGRSPVWWDTGGLRCARSASRSTLPRDSGASTGPGRCIQDRAWKRGRAFALPRRSRWVG